MNVPVQRPLTTDVRQCNCQSEGMTLAPQLLGDTLTCNRQSLFDCRLTAFVDKARNNSWKCRDRRPQEVGIGLGAANGIRSCR